MHCRNSDGESRSILRLLIYGVTIRYPGAIPKFSVSPRCGGNTDPGMLTVQYWLVRGIPNNLGSFPLIEPVLFGTTPVQMGLIEIPIIDGLNFQLCKRGH